LGIAVCFGMAGAYALSSAEEQQLRQWIGAHGTPQQVASTSQNCIESVGLKM
jgi:hypothetical protein